MKIIGEILNKVPEVNSLSQDKKKYFIKVKTSAERTYQNLHINICTWFFTFKFSPSFYSAKLLKP